MATHMTIPETIPEEDIFDAGSPTYQMASVETILEKNKVDEAPPRPGAAIAEGYLQISKATRFLKQLKQLKDSYKIATSFRRRLDEIYDACQLLVVDPVGHRWRLRWAQLNYMMQEVATHVQQRLASDVVQLRDFLRGRLFEEYCLMRATAMEDKNEAWLAYGRNMMAKHKDFDHRMADRLVAVVDASELDPGWVRVHILDYCHGNAHIGQWQRYQDGRRWMELAAKFWTDMGQLDTINRANLTDSRRCKIMYNICSTKRRFFKKLDATGYELSEKALRMDEAEEEEGDTSSSSSSSSSSSPSTTPLAAVWQEDGD